MAEFRRLRAEARRRLRKLASQISQDIAAERTVDIEAVKKDVETLTGVTALRSPWERVIYAAIPFLLAVIVLSAAWFVPVPAPYVEVEVTVGRVTIGLPAPEAKSPYKLTGFPPLKRLAVQRLDAITSDTPALNATAVARGSAELTGGVITLSQIDVGPTSPSATSGQPSITIERAGSLLQIGTTGLALTSRLVIQSPVRIATAFPAIRNDTKIEHASLALISGPGSLLSLELASDGAVFELPPIRPRLMGFNTILYDAHGSQVLVSTIQRGTVNFKAGTSRDLAGGAVLTLRNLDGLARVRAEGTALKVNYAGRAGTIGLSGQDDEAWHDLRPSLAEWLGTDRDVASLWSALVFLTGLVLSVRRSFT